MILELGTGDPPFVATPIPEAGYGNTHLTCQAISAMSAYANKSLEELRFEDYCKAGKIMPVKGKSGRIACDSENMAQHLGELLKDEIFADVTFVVEDKKLRAHRNILASRSDKFHAMFASGLSESRRNAEIRIGDNTTYEAFAALLEFCYTGNAPIKKDVNLTLELLQLGEEYLLSSLKDRCEAELIKYINIDTLNQLLSLADLHSLKCLKAHCADYVFRHYESVLSSAEFLALDKRVMIDILSSACARLKLGSGLLTPFVDQASQRGTAPTHPPEWS